jgi:hypothetical protein
MARIKLTR